MKLKLLIKNKKIQEIAFLLIITTIAAFLRLNKISAGLPFTFDQAEYYLYVREIVGGKLVLIGPRTGIEGFFLGPLYFYLLLPFYILFKGHPLGGAVMDACFGILAVPLIFFLTKKLFSKKVAVIATIITCFSPLLVGYSRYSWNPHPLIFFAVLFYYAITQVLEGKEAYIILVFFSFACGLQLEIASAIYYLPTAIIIFYWTKFKPKKYLFWLIGLIILLVSFIPQIVFNLRHQLLMGKALMTYFLNGAKSDKNIFDVFLLRFQQLFTTYRQVITGGQLIILPLTLLLLSLYNLIIELKKKSKPIILLFCWLTVNFILFFTTREHLWDHHYISLYPVYIILTTLLFNKLFGLNKLKLFSHLLFIILIANYLVSYWPSKKTENKQLVFKDQLEAIDYIYRDAKGKPFNTLIYVPSVYDHSYRYIFEWYGKRKYGYLPSANNEKLVYLIVEPDNEIPLRKENWLDTKKNEGRRIKSQDFGGGLMIEKRERK